MVNLFDIARDAGRGTGFGTLSRQFGLDPRQTERAVEALLPAFTLAFQRSVQDPGAFANLIGVIGSGQYAGFFDGGAFGRTGAGSATGASLVEQLFKSPDATRRIAEQAASAAGVGVQVIQAMMPVVAATLIGGMFRYASVEGFSDLLREWSDALKAAAPRASRPEPASDPWSAWQEIAGRMMGHPPPAPPRPVPASTHPIEAWTAMMAAMVGVPSALPPPPPKEPSPFEALARMFETGREVQAQHLAGLQSILDGVWGVAARSR